MDTTESWRQIFENWPETIPKSGILVTRYQESIGFADFLISGGILLLERSQPDGVGARKVMLAYSEIAAVKITNVVDLARFQVMGFQTPF